MKKIIYSSLMLAILAACSKENKDVVTPTSPEDMPIQIVLDADEDGNVEDDDKATMAFTFTDRMDPTGEEIGGITPTLSQPATITCMIKDPEGFGNLGDYILDIKALYEVDDCTEADITVTYDLSTGEFSFEFPAGVEEVEVEFELNDALFDDDVVSDDRGFVVEVLGLSNTSEKVVINTDTEFEYKVLDDELIFGEYELDLTQQNLDMLKTLFGAVNEDLADLDLADIDAFEMEVSLEDIEFKTVLIEEEADECDPADFSNVEVSVEGEFEELTDDELTGDIEFIVELEADNGAVEEFTYEGSFEINGDDLILTLECEDLETGEVTLTYTR
ncbi:hypothetical protein [Owenweeksia hongkongensis]|uniref:hypothetical protein n=1 Tax=Owenweeksia hongkongensis TaxID=253245 RepID=UPI003A905270